MEYIFAVLVGLVLGFALGWLWAASKTRAASASRFTDLDGKLKVSEELQAGLRSQLQAREAELTKMREQLSNAQVEHATIVAKMEEARTRIDEQRRLLDDASAKLADTFKALSAEALSSNNESFLKLAAERLRTLQMEAQGDLLQRQQAIQGLIKPLEEVLKSYQVQAQEIERERQKTYGSLDEKLRALGETSQRLQLETTNLATALKKPGVKGRWGEVTLRRVVEAAGMSEYCDFVEQPTADAQEGRRRADLLVKLPGDRSIVVDAKVPLAAYMEAMETEDEVRREGLLKQHAAAVRASIRELGSKSYWSQFEQAPNFVVLFLPGESLFSAALGMDRDLIVDGVADKIILATPTTLIACLLIVAYGWQQQKMTENAIRIAETGSDLYERLLKFNDHLCNIRNAANKMGEVVNDAIGSFESRLVPGARKLRELGAGESMSEIEPPEPIETSLPVPRRRSITKN